jgi:hypothetical protein
MKVWGFLASCALACAFTLVVGAQEDTDRRVAAAIGGFEAGDWNERSLAFYGLLNLVVSEGFHGETWKIAGALESLFRRLPDREDEVRRGLIGLLERETALGRTSRDLPEEYHNYRGDLIGAVAGLRDRRAIEVLAENIGTGNMATRGLAALGRPAVDPILLRMTARNVITRNGAVRALSQLLEANPRGQMERQALERITDALVVAAGDSVPAVRLSAVAGLSQLPGERVTAVLRGLAEEDPYKLPRVDSTGPVEYPVREEARRALWRRVR